MADQVADVQDIDVNWKGRWRIGPQEIHNNTVEGFSASLSAACAVSTSIAARSTCTAICQNLTSATATA
jgi:hypothetical protein